MSLVRMGWRIQRNSGRTIESTELLGLLLVGQLGGSYGEPFDYSG